jgi:hypothetical protein
MHCPGGGRLTRPCHAQDWSAPPAWPAAPRLQPSWSSPPRAASSPNRILGLQRAAGRDPNQGRVGGTPPGRQARITAFFSPPPGAAALHAAGPAANPRAAPTGAPTGPPASGAADATLGAPFARQPARAPSAAPGRPGVGLRSRSSAPQPGERGAARGAGVSVDALWPKEWARQGAAGAQAAAPSAATAKGRGADAADARPKAAHGGKLRALVAQAEAQERGGGPWQGWGAGVPQGRASGGGLPPTRGALWWCAPMRQLEGAFPCCLTGAG